MKSKFFIIAILLAGTKAMAAPSPKLKTGNSHKAFFKTLHIEHIHDKVRAFLSSEDENAFSVSDKRLAQGQKHLEISHHESRLEEICDMFLRKDIHPFLESFIVRKQKPESSKIIEKILALLEKNSSTLRKVVLHSWIFAKTRVLNERGLSPLEKSVKEKNMDHADLHLKNFPKLEALKILDGKIRLSLLENTPNLKILDIENVILSTKVLENLSLTELNINRANPKDQDNPFAYLPSTLKKLSMSEFRDPIAVFLFIQQLERFKNLEYLFFDVYGFKVDITPILEKLPLLKQLHINGLESYEDSVKSLKDLSCLKHLTHLSLTKAKYLEDFSEIFKLTNLKYLDLSGSFFTDLQLEAVWLTSNITNQSLKGIEKLTELRYLGLAATGVTELSNIQNLKKLEHLNLADSDIESLEGIQNLENLRILDLSSIRPFHIPKGLPDLLAIKDAQLSKLSIFMACRQKIYRGAVEAVITLKQKGVRFLKRDKRLSYLIEDQVQDVSLNMIEMAKAYKENPFLHPAYRQLIED